MKSLKWGVIGPGDIAKNFANDLKLAEGDQKITAVLSHREESANDFAEEFNVPQSFTNLEDFVNESGVDIVYIATPHTYHYKDALACLKNKIAVLCEKPIVINRRQHTEILRLSVKNKTFLMEGMWLRFLPHMNKLLELVKENRIGEIITVKASMSFKAPQDEDSRYYDPEKGGGSLLDLGVYCIFLSTLLLGNCDAVKAVGKLSEQGVDTGCGILLSYANGSYAILESSLFKNHNGPAEIFGTKGIIRIQDPWFEKSPGLEIEMEDGNKETIPFEWEGHGLQYEINEVVKCISEGKVESPLMPAVISNDILDIMDIVRKQIHVHYDTFE